MCRTIADVFSNQLLPNVAWEKAYSMILGNNDWLASQSMDSLKELILTPNYICDKLLRLCDDRGSYTEIDAYGAAQQIISSKPGFLKDNHFIDNLY
jgi:hypothetical protein